MSASHNTHAEVPFICMFCGGIHERMREDGRADPNEVVECKTCRREARPATIMGLFAITRGLIRQNEELRSRLFDLECEAEERAEPGVSTA